MLTVFTSCYNHGEYLAEAIESVLNQTYQDFEYLLYDDGSTDDTKDVMESYDDPRIKKFYLDKQSNVGCVVNKSFEEMRGSVWVWCPADDALLPQLLLTKLTHPKYMHVLYSDWEVMSGGERRLAHLQPHEFKQAMQTSCPIGMTGIWIPKGAIGGAGYFPTHLWGSEDFYWVLKALKVGVEFYHIPEILYKKRNHSESTTARNARTIDIDKTVQMIRAELA